VARGMLLGACGTLRICAKRFGSLAVTTLPVVSFSFNPALVLGDETSEWLFNSQHLPRDPVRPSSGLHEMA